MSKTDIDIKSAIVSAIGVGIGSGVGSLGKSMFFERILLSQIVNNDPA